ARRLSQRALLDRRAALHAGEALRPALRGRRRGAPTGGAEHRADEAFADVGDARAAEALSTADVGAEARAHVGAFLRLGAEALEAHRDRSPRGTRRGRAGHRAGARAARGRSLGRDLPGGDARALWTNGPLWAERRAPRVGRGQARHPGRARRGTLLASPRLAEACRDDPREIGRASCRGRESIEERGEGLDKT